MFKRMKSEDKTKSESFYLSSKAEIIIKGSDIDKPFQSIYAKTRTKIFRKRFRLDY